MQKQRLVCVSVCMGVWVGVGVGSDTEFGGCVGVLDLLIGW